MSTHSVNCCLFIKGFWFGETLQAQWGNGRRLRERERERGEGIERGGEGERERGGGGREKR